MVIYIGNTTWIEVPIVGEVPFKITNLGNVNVFLTYHKAVFSHNFGSLWKDNIEVYEVLMPGVSVENKREDVMYAMCEFGNSRLNIGN